MRIWNSLLLGLKSLISFKGKMDVFVKMVSVVPPWIMPDCAEDKDSLCSSIFIFSPFFWMQDEKKFRKCVGQTSIFTVQWLGRKGAPLVHLPVGVGTWPFLCAELSSVKQSKNKFSESEKSYLSLPTLYFSYLFLSMLYFVPKGKKPGMYSLGRKDKGEKLYCFGNYLVELLQANWWVYVYQVQRLSY